MSKVFDCPQCHRVIGKIKKIDQVELLEVDQVLCREFRGTCSVCGREIRYSISDGFIMALIKRSQSQ